MLHTRICDRRSEALAEQKATECLRSKAVRARKSTAQTDEHRGFKTTPASTQAVRDLRHSAFKKAIARLQHSNDRRLQQTKPNVEVVRPEENFSRSRELQWLTAHRHAYPGLWLALDGAVLVASDKSLAEALRQASRRGSANPLVVWSDETAEAPFGGW